MMETREQLVELDRLYNARNTKMFVMLGPGGDTLKSVDVSLNFDWTETGMRSIIRSDIGAIAVGLIDFLPLR